MDVNTYQTITATVGSSRKQHTRTIVIAFLRLRAMMMFSSLSTSRSMKQELLRSVIFALVGRFENRSFCTGPIINYIVIYIVDCLLLTVK
jgi:hypothetical protein